MRNDVPSDVTFTSYWPGDSEATQLLPNGKDKPVTKDNLDEFFNAYSQWRLDDLDSERFGLVSSQIYRFMRAKCMVRRYPSPEKLAKGMGGENELDLHDWKLNTQIEIVGRNYAKFKETISWFWRYLEGLDQRDRSKVLQFVTGSPRVPAGGFGSLPLRFNLQPMHYAAFYQGLPEASSCESTLYLPCYESFKVLREKMDLAVNETNVFGLD
ncbi:MAG: hypothetical protein SGCHY_004608 [Lobulomycetales sp.]